MNRRSLQAAAVAILALGLAWVASVAGETPETPKQGLVEVTYYYLPG